MAEGARREISVFPSAQGLAQACADLIAEIGMQSIRAKGYFSLVLAGGSTPMETYTLLADKNTKTGLEWFGTHIFFGDERCVPPDDERSNFGKAKQQLLAKVALPDENVHRMKGEHPPEAAAQNYQAEIRRFFSARGALPEGQPPAFDVILLGMGSDGHTASLFPGDETLEEMEKWVVWTPHKNPPEPLVPRLTLTLPILNAGRVVVFLVTGAEKARRAAAVLGKDGDKFPAGRVTGAEKLLWFLDEGAAQVVQAAV